MRIACLQFSPQVGDVNNNLNRADSVLNRANPKDLDLLVLPELAFTGYNFRSLQHITPYLEPTAAGITSLWARTTALKHNCVVTAGYPEKVDVAPKWPAGPEYYNSTITVNSEGETIANYRKSFLYYTDETWALEGPSGFFTGHVEGLGNVAMGICTDLNPYKLEAPWTAWEFGQHILRIKANLVVLSMAWLTREEARAFSRAPKDPDMETLSFWLARLEPVIRAETEGEIIVVFANRCGSEDDYTYAGTSAVLGINAGEVKVYGILGRGEKELLVVDTSKRPSAKLISQPSSSNTAPPTPIVTEPPTPGVIEPRTPIAGIEEILQSQSPKPKKKELEIQPQPISKAPPATDVGANKVLNALKTTFFDDNDYYDDYEESWRSPLDCGYTPIDDFEPGQQFGEMPGTFGRFSPGRSPLRSSIERNDSAVLPRAPKRTESPKSRNASRSRTRETEPRRPESRNVSRSRTRETEEVIISVPRRPESRNVSRSRTRRSEESPARVSRGIDPQSARNPSRSRTRARQLDDAIANLPRRPRSRSQSRQSRDPADPNRSLGAQPRSDDIIAIVTLPRRPDQHSPKLKLRNPSRSRARKLDDVVTTLPRRPDSQSPKSRNPSQTRGRQEGGIPVVLAGSSKAAVVVAVADGDGAVVEQRRPSHPHPQPEPVVPERESRFARFLRRSRSASW